MIQIEGDSRGLIKFAEKAFSSNTVDDGRKKEMRQRRSYINQCLEVADTAIKSHGIPVEGKADSDFQTSPVSVDDTQFYIRQTTDVWSYSNRPDPDAKTVYITIEALRGEDVPRTVFSIRQNIMLHPHKNTATEVFNQFDRVASSEEVLEGLRGIIFINNALNLEFSTPTQLSSNQTLVF